MLCSEDGLLGPPTLLDREDLGLPARLAFRALAGYLRRRDRAAAQATERPDVVIAIPASSRNEYDVFRGREANVIHPPVDVERVQQVIRCQESMR